MTFNKSNVPESVFTENIDEEKHNNNNLIKQGNFNTELDGANGANSKESNLQEIMFQASRKISSGGFNYDDDIYKRRCIFRWRW